MHQGRLGLGNRGADRVGALAALGPGGAGLQGDPVGLFQEVFIAQRVEDDTVGVRQDHHIVSVDDLLVERLHGRHGMGMQEPVLLDDPAQRAPVDGAVVHVAAGIQAIVARPQVGRLDDRIAQIWNSFLLHVSPSSRLRLSLM